MGYPVDSPMNTLERQVVTVTPAAQPQGDELLVSAARAGDRSAFGLLYGRYARMVHGILLSRVPLREVDDLVQEVFLSALRQLHSLRNVAKFGSWLATITRNRANDYFRRAFPAERILEPLSGEPGTGTASEDKGGDPSADGEAAAILEVIRALPEAYREPLILRLVEGMNGPEIAARTGLTHGSVRVNLCRGMQMLREKLGALPKASHDPQAGEPALRHSRGDLRS